MPVSDHQLIGAWNQVLTLSKRGRLDVTDACKLHENEPQRM